MADASLDRGPHDCCHAEDLSRYLDIDNSERKPGLYVIEFFVEVVRESWGVEVRELKEAPLYIRPLAGLEEIY